MTRVVLGALVGLAACVEEPAREPLVPDDFDALEEVVSTPLPGRRLVGLAWVRDDEELAVLELVGAGQHRVHRISPDGRVVRSSSRPIPVDGSLWTSGALAVTFAEDGLLRAHDAAGETAWSLPASGEPGPKVRTVTHYLSAASSPASDEPGVVSQALDRSTWTYSDLRASWPRLGVEVLLYGSCYGGTMWTKPLRIACPWEGSVWLTDQDGVDVRVIEGAAGRYATIVYAGPGLPAVFAYPSDEPSVASFVDVVDLRAGEVTLRIEGAADVEPDAISPDGTLLLARDSLLDADTVVVWELSTGRRVDAGRIFADDGIVDVAWGDGGRSVVVLDGAGALHVWRLD